MTTQKSRAIEAVKALVPDIEQIQTLADALDEAQNPPPEGAADGSLNLHQWNALRRVERAAAALREYIVAAERAGLLLRPRPR